MLVRKRCLLRACGLWNELWSPVRDCGAAGTLGQAAGWPTTHYVTEAQEDPKVLTPHISSLSPLIPEIPESSQP